MGTALWTFPQRKHPETGYVLLPGGKAGAHLFRVSKFPGAFHVKAHLLLAGYGMQDDLHSVANAVPCLRQVIRDSVRIVNLDSIKKQVKLGKSFIRCLVRWAKRRMSFKLFAKCFFTRFWISVRACSTKYLCKTVTR